MSRLRSFRARLRPRLRTVLLLTNLVVLVLPLAGVTVLRLYESALIRQTESELVAQGAVIAASYRALHERLLAANGGPADPADAGLPLQNPPPASGYDDNPWRPRPPQLDLARDPVLPKPPEPAASALAATPLAQAIGPLIEPILRSAQITTLAGMRVVDAGGTVVASTFEAEHCRSLLAFDEVQRALRGEPVSSLRDRHAGSPPSRFAFSRANRVRVFVAMPIVLDNRVLGAVLLVRTPADIRQALVGKRNELLFGTLLVFAMVLALSVLTSRRITQPVEAVIEQARRAARGEQGAVTPLAKPGTREIGELSETVAAMAATLESRARYIRDFAAHVSHEFKTPLTAIRGSVELLREHEDSMSAEERNRFLAMIEDDSGRLERLVQRLLELARADMSTRGDEHCRLDAILRPLAARFAARGLLIDLGLDADAEVAIGADTLDAVIGTLLDNCRQHAGLQARVQLQVRIDTAAVIELIDDGLGISPANATKIFEPFFTTARQRGSTGLGLSIVRSLLSAHGGDIALLPSTTGAHFRIRLPLVPELPN
ncbi:ATP-binding protein [Nevskia sp.]|uniref:sensor histidine kinase n=1 Tax=Nevskia sp. TaxID=1929292 RepID=UPI002601514A|nr:ATP-binding protein [Nevskia sp.]